LGHGQIEGTEERGLTDDDLEIKTFEAVRRRTNAPFNSWLKDYYRAEDEHLEEDRNTFERYC
jgi:hypothetical protein